MSTQERKGWFTHSDAIAAVAMVVSVYSAIVSQRAYNHSVGKNYASLSLVKVVPDPQEVPDRFKTENPIAPGKLYFENLDRLLAFNPVLIVENTGSEPIGEIRIEIIPEFGMVDVVGMPKAKQLEKTRWARKQIDRKDYQLSSKLLPGRKLHINLIAGLVAQMMEVQNLPVGDRLHFGYFDIKCFAKLVGAVSFDEMQERPKILIGFGWRPDGFTKEQAGEYLKEFDAPPVELDERDLQPAQMERFK